MYCRGYSGGCRPTWDLASVDSHGLWIRLQDQTHTRADSHFIVLGSSRRFRLGVAAG